MFQFGNAHSHVHLTSEGKIYPSVDVSVGSSNKSNALLYRKALTRYQMLFRHMFYCKHVERLLCNVWISNKTAKQYSLHSAKW